jgi:hypothetical protein
MSRKRKGRARRHGPAPRRQPSRDERVLRERIQKSTYQERFAADVERALRAYFGPGAVQPEGTLTLDQGQVPAFQERYIFDRPTAQGERIIDLFAAEVGPRLPAAQQETLKGCDYLAKERRRQGEPYLDVDEMGRNLVR